MARRYSVRYKKSSKVTVPSIAALRMADLDPDSVPILLGELSTTQFCPNPNCRYPFSPSSALEAAAHFDPNTACGRWLSSVTSATYHEACPIPTCQHVFDDQNEAIFHLTDDSSPCATWFRELLNNKYPEYPGLNEVVEDDIDDDPDDFDPAFYTPTQSNSVAASISPFDEDSTPYHDPRMKQANLPNGSRVTFHQNEPVVFRGGHNIIQAIDEQADEDLGEKRCTHPFYPFANKLEWELGSWLMAGGLSMREIDKFLQLDFIRQIRPSFSSAQVLRSYIESLPAVPAWHYQEISVRGYPTKTKMFLYWRDGRDVIEHLFANPIFTNSIELTPYRAFDHSNYRIYGEFMSADFAWEQQLKLPAGHTLLGVIGASDKTCLTFGTGAKEMHPFLLSIANIQANVRMKASAHAFALAAYLPIPKFKDVSKSVQAILSARVFHKCISIVTRRLKAAASLDPQCAALMSNPWGGRNFCHTPLVSWIADYPEMLLISCTAAKQSPISVASAAQFGDEEPHPARTREHILTAIKEASRDVEPWDIAQYYRSSQKFHLNGVHQPFWEDWGSADPSLFLTPDALHQWHKFFFDHIVKWAINIMGPEELDYRLMVLQPCVGARQWPHGVSTLKQCTGRDHRALEALIVAVIAGAVPIEVLRAIRALMDFIYQAQNLYHYDDTLHALKEALREFHFFKQSIIIHGGRRGKSGILSHFDIPKLELMQHVGKSIQAMGAAYQWTSDTTERCHIVLVKRPYRLSNRRNFHEQCCRFLDREDKLRLFSLFTLLKTSEAGLESEMQREANEMAVHQPESQWTSHILPEEQRFQVTASTQPQRSLFERAHSLISADRATAFLLTRTPHRTRVPIEDAAISFDLPDLRPALGDWCSHAFYNDRRGIRRASADCPLPFTHVNIWLNVRLQQCSAQDDRILTPVQTLQALPPSEEMPYGRYHHALVNFESASESQDERSGVVELQLIFQPIMDSSPFGPFLFYGNYFKFESKDEDGSPSPVPGIDMFLLKQNRRSNGAPMGDILAVEDIRHQVQLVPKFGQRAPDGLDCNNSTALTDVFYVNNFSGKETFHAILSYQ